MKRLTTIIKEELARRSDANLAAPAARKLIADMIATRIKDAMLDPKIQRVSADHDRVFIVYKDAYKVSTEALSTDLPEGVEDPSNFKVTDNGRYVVWDDEHKVDLYECIEKTYSEM